MVDVSNRKFAILVSSKTYFKCSFVLTTKNTHPLTTPYHFTFSFIAYDELQRRRSLTGRDQPGCARVATIENTRCGVFNKSPGNDSSSSRASSASKASTSAGARLPATPALARMRPRQPSAVYGMSRSYEKVSTLEKPAACKWGKLPRSKPFPPPKPQFRLCFMIIRSVASTTLPGNGIQLKYATTTLAWDLVMRENSNAAFGPSNQCQHWPAETTSATPSGSGMASADPILYSTVTEAATSSLRA